MMFSRLSISALVVLGISGAPSAALMVESAPPPPDYHFSMKINDNAAIPIYGAVTNIPDGNGWKYQIDVDYNVSGSHVIFSVLIDPDPSVLASVSVQNNTGITQNYAFDFQAG